MHRVPFILCLLAVVPLISASAADVEKEFATADGKKLEVDLKTGGAIAITGWEKGTVSVKAFRKGSDAGEVEIEMKETSWGVLVSSEFPGSRRHKNASIDLEIRVPRRYDLSLLTTGGEISIEDVDGTIEGETMGGELHLRQLKGSLRLQTMGGAIRLTDSEVDGKVKTMGGDVLLQNVAGNVDARSMGGKVIQKNVHGREEAGDDHEVKISSMGGELGIDDAPNGADLHTMGGNIHVKSAKKFVKASTMGGSVGIDDVDGWVEASTMGGPIDVRMSGDPAKGDRHVSLRSMGGEITLAVPADLAMEFDIELAFTRDHENDYKIISDFPVQQRTDEEWERHDGTPRKVIHGTGKTGSGTNLVKIRTINGNVVIKKI